VECSEIGKEARYELVTQFCGSWEGEFRVQVDLSILPVSASSAQVRDLIPFDLFYILVNP